MDKFAINGDTLNGQDGVPSIAASADLSASAMVSAVAQLTMAIAATISCTAAVAAAPKIIAAGVGNISGAAYIQAAPTHIQAANAHLEAGAEISAYVLREVSGTAAMGGSAEFMAIPASLVGAADIVAGANIIADATRVQATHAALGGSADMQSIATRIQNAEAMIAAGAQMRAEANHNNLHDGFADLVANADLSIVEAGMVTRFGHANIDGGASISAHATKVQATRSDASISADFVAEPLVLSTIDPVTFDAGAAFHATASRWVLPSADFISRADFYGTPYHFQQAAAALSAGAEVTANGSITTGGVATLAAGADFAAQATRVVTLEVSIACPAQASAEATLNLATTGNLMGASAQVTPLPTLFRMASADMLGGCTFDAFGQVIVLASAALDATAGIEAQSVVHRLAAASFDGSCDLEAQATRICQGSATINATAEVVATGRATERHYGEALFACTSILTADGFVNAMALDPPERTMERPFATRVMDRPFTEREMRRAA